MTSPAKPGAPKLTAEQEAQAKQAAMAVVQTYYSALRDQVKLESMPQYGGPGEEQVRRFRFARYVGGIPVPGDAIDVTIDVSTMKWRDMNANWTTGLTLPDPATVISPEAAKAVVTADRKPLLTYRPIYRTMTKEEMASGNDMSQVSEAALTYILTPQVAFQVNAFSGKAVAYDGVALSDLEAASKRVTGHWAEGELQFMLARRVIRPEELNPDATVSRAQAVMMLLTRNQRNSFSGAQVTLPYTDLPDTDPAYGALRVAWQEGWLRPLGNEQTFRPGAPITRAEFAVWAARAMNLGGLARSDVKVIGGYKDLDRLTIEQRNAISFLRALKLLGATDTFRPNEPLTQAEGAALTARIYNYLLAEKQ
jgi:hypothetical protein